MTSPDLEALLSVLTVPRPSGSAAERTTLLELQAWLDAHGIAHRTQRFRLYPYFFECVGVWLIVMPLVLAAAVWLRAGWATLPIALLTLVGGTLDVALGVPFITWPGGRAGDNVLVERSPKTARREIVLSAHYDSKTELLDHRQRLWLLKGLKPAMAIGLGLGLAGPVERWLFTSGADSTTAVFLAASLLTVPLLAVTLPLGASFAVGRFLPPSRGAVDNGGSCAILLELARRLAADPGRYPGTRITIALFTGEEVNMQGSRAYVRSRDWPLPTAALNLEIMAQDGDYVVWDRDGSLFRLMPTSPEMNRALGASVAEITGRSTVWVGPLSSDAQSFLFAGIPAATLSTHDYVRGDSGLHSPRDNRERLVVDRIPEGVEVVEAFLERYDRGEILFGDERNPR